MTISAPRETDTPPVAVPSFVAANVLHLILMPTEKCDFRCVYCFEDFEYGRMARPTIDGLRRLIEGRAPTLDALTLDWFGGEPLLELPIIEEIQAHVQRLAREHPSMVLRAGITTNGYRLFPDVLSRLVGLGVGHYQIALDGTAEAHDARRRRGDGAGTFEQIWSNLMTARDSELRFDICVRLHVDRENQNELTDLLERLARELGDDQRFEIFLRPISRLGGPNDSALPILEGREIEVVADLRRRAMALGLRLYSGAEPDACYASAANSFVIRSTGEIAKCTVAFQHPNNRVGQLHPDGTATLDNAKINGWVRGLFSGDPEELHCPMKGFADSRPATGGLKVLSA